jgi:sugar phosphate isomerase/epimerase
MLKTKKCLALSFFLLYFSFFSLKVFSQAIPLQEKIIPEEIKQEVRQTNYNEVRIKKFPLAMQCWTYRRYTFFEALDKTKALGIDFVQAYPGQRLSKDLPLNVVFNHQLTDEQIKLIKDRLNSLKMQIVAYGVVDLGRTEAEMRKVFDFARKIGINTIVTEPQDNDYPVLEKLVKEYNIKIAIHNHPEPAKYAYPLTVLRYIKNLDDRIGVCADTGHWMRCGLKPVECLRLLKGRIIDVHLKDRSDFGTQKAEDVAFGQGKADIKDILAELTLQDYDGYLTIEYENENEVLTPEPTIKKGMEYIKSITYYEGYEQLLKRYDGLYEKHGWNHYGPGYFELDEKSGVLKSQGGMGLLWYSRKKFRDFILELDYKCSKKDTNSGVFLRVPEVPTSDDYIYHSFEIQIYDAGEGIHKTGAAYDAEAPKLDAAKPTGEWNHMKITFVGKHLIVELNGKTILDWEAQPRGKVHDFALEGYIGLQNHDSQSPVYFKNIYIKELAPAPAAGKNQAGG